MQSMQIILEGSKAQLKFRHVSNSISVVFLLLLLFSILLFCIYC